MLRAPRGQRRCGPLLSSRVRSSKRHQAPQMVPGERARADNALAAVPPFAGWAAAAGVSPGAAPSPLGLDIQPLCEFCEFFEASRTAASSDGRKTPEAAPGAGSQASEKRRHVCWDHQGTGPEAAVQANACPEKTPPNLRLNVTGRQGDHVGLGPASAVQMASIWTDRQTGSEGAGPGTSGPALPVITVRRLGSSPRFQVQFRGLAGAPASTEAGPAREDGLRAQPAELLQAPQKDSWLRTQPPSSNLQPAGHSWGPAVPCVGHRLCRAFWTTPKPLAEEPGPAAWACGLQAAVPLCSPPPRTHRPLWSQAEGLHGRSRPPRGSRSPRAGQRARQRCLDPPRPPASAVVSKWGAKAWRLGSSGVDAARQSCAGRSVPGVRESADALAPETAGSSPLQRPAHPLRPRSSQQRRDPDQHPRPDPQELGPLRTHAGEHPRCPAAATALPAGRQCTARLLHQRAVPAAGEVPAEGRWLRAARTASGGGKEPADGGAMGVAVGTEAPTGDVSRYSTRVLPGVRSGLAEKSHEASSAPDVRLPCGHAEQPGDRASTLLQRREDEQKWEQQVERDPELELHQRLDEQRRGLEGEREAALRGSPSRGALARGAACTRVLGWPGLACLSHWALVACPQDTIAGLTAQLEAFQAKARRVEQSIQGRDYMKHRQEQGGLSAFWERELESLHFVIEMRSQRVHELDRRLALMETVVRGPPRPPCPRGCRGGRPVSCRHRACAPLAPGPPFPGAAPARAPSGEGGARAESEEAWALQEPPPTSGHMLLPSRRPHSPEPIPGDRAAGPSWACCRPSLACRRVRSCALKEKSLMLEEKVTALQQENETLRARSLSQAAAARQLSEALEDAREALDKERRLRQQLQQEKEELLFRVLGAPTASPFPLPPAAPAEVSLAT
ncbi:Coiled-coil domain-containing protein 69 [Galemys pyrenaicus]|uniref:Coiled-coil domain-containing protein 69 n=1 Tax=Galemys pyrenaicus TaxID=202257 RepID=A0A8J5ZY72_GALPY|nr:Coiled-coil domain-containing protein 69 [Galemys pyrenaicus]